MGEITKHRLTHGAVLVQAVLYHVAGRSQNKYQRLDAGISVGANPTPGSLYMARVPERSKGAVRKTVIRKFESCPVLQLVSYNNDAKTNRISFCLSPKEPSLRGLFGGYRIAI